MGEMRIPSGGGVQPPNIHQVKKENQPLGIEIPVSTAATKSDFYGSVVKNENEAEKAVQVALYVFFGKQKELE